MKIFKTSISIFLLVAFCNLFPSKKANAQEIGGFSGGTIDLPSIDTGGLGGLLPPAVAEIFIDIAGLIGEVDTFLAELGLEVGLGALGLPDVLEAIELFEQEPIDIFSDFFGSQTGSTVEISDVLYKQFLRDVGQDFSQNIALSMEGQENIVEQVELGQEIAEISNQFAEDSEGQDVSQNILRNISNQLALQQQLDNMAFFDTQKHKVERSINLAMMGESIISLDRLNIREERQRTAAINQSLYSNALISIPLQHRIEGQ